VSTTSVRARPTTYKGIAMRSRLEADYAARLDRRAGESWEYESRCFANERGQYLPDFRSVRTSGRYAGDVTYIEVKPLNLLPTTLGPREAAEKIDPLLQRMAIIWSSEPTAGLALVFWEMGLTEVPAQIVGVPDEFLWWYFVPSHPATLWPGMGQMDRIK
jgi:hypothetical protein